jgi:hypothetical protein
LDSGKVSEFIGIVPECSRRFRSGDIVGPLDGGLHGPKGECPGHLGQAHQAPKAQLASPGDTLRDSSRRKGETCPHSSPLAVGPRTWRRGQAGRPASNIREGWGAAPLSPNPSRRPIAAPPPLSLTTARRRSPAAETLHHKQHAIVLLNQSISPPYLLDQGRRIRRCTIRVHLSEASPLVALDQIGSDREEMASTTISSTFC